MYKSIRERAARLVTAMKHEAHYSNVAGATALGEDPPRPIRDEGMRSAVDHALRPQKYESAADEPLMRRNVLFLASESG
jgi:hypothetical protein